MLWKTATSLLEISAVQYQKEGQISIQANYSDTHEGSTIILYPMTSVLKKKAEGEILHSKRDILSRFSLERKYKYVGEEPRYFQNPEYKIQMVSA